MNYRTGIISSLADVGEAARTALLAAQGDANPFLSYAQYLVLWDGPALATIPAVFV